MTNHQHATGTPHTWGQPLPNRPTNRTRRQRRRTRSWRTVATTVLLIAMAGGMALVPANQFPLPTRVTVAVGLATWPIWTRGVVRSVAGLGRGLPIVVRVVLGVLVLSAAAVAAVLLLANGITLAEASR